MRLFEYEAKALLSAGGIAVPIAYELGLPVKLAEEPLTCVAEGAARALRNRPLLAAYGRN